ncbi:MAG: hypothetical protein ACRDRT_03155 [Pseudonocardiaceae bacterium]
MRAAGVVENLGQHPLYVVVIVEDLVVVTAATSVAANEDRIGSVYLDLPDVWVFEEWL